MDLHKLDAVKKEISRLNIYILRISELKWTGIGGFNSNDPYVYYYGQESHTRNGVALIVNKRSEMQYLGASSKMSEYSLFISMANHSTSQQFKSMPQLLMVKKLKLTGSMKTNNIF